MKIVHPPPRLARALLKTAAPASICETVDGDLFEAYQVALSKGLTRKQANWRYRRDVVRSLPPLLGIDLTPRHLPVLVASAALGTLVVSMLALIIGAVGGWLGYRSVSSTAALLNHVLLVAALAPLGGLVAVRASGSDTPLAAILAAVLLVGPAATALGQPGTGPDVAKLTWIVLIPITTTLGGMVLSRRRRRLHAG